MNHPTIFRCTAVAALAALAGAGTSAMEATQWDPQADAVATASSDATRNPLAWVDDHGEATQFHDAIARDSVTARADVRAELQQARAQGLLNDTGEGGATERVLAQREAFNQSERERLLALNTPSVPQPDEIAQVALTPRLLEPHSDEGG